MSARRSVARRKAKDVRKESGFYCPRCGCEFKMYQKHPFKENAFVVKCRRNHTFVKEHTPDEPADTTATETRDLGVSTS